MTTVDLFQRLGLALAIGLLIGLERGWRERDTGEGSRSAGLRTHALAGLLGGVWGALVPSLGAGGGPALGLAFATFAGIVALFRYRETGAEGTFGATTVVSAMLVFALGAYAVLGDMQVAAAAAVASVALLALKQPLHGWVRRLTWTELRSALTLLAMTFLLLPILPDRPIDPFGAVNPREVWLMVIMIAGVSFAGYVAVKATGERSGIIVTAIAGGLASSTAVTLTMARLSREHPERTALTTAGALLAGATMIGRVLVVVGLLGPGMLPLLVTALLPAGLVLLGAALWLLRGATGDAGEEGLDLANPFELATVLQFGGLLVGAMLLASLATSYAGPAGAYVLAALSGIADVDAVTLSMVRLARGELAMDVAARAIAIAVAVNTVIKGVFAVAVGARRLGGRLVAVSALAIAVGAVVSFGLAAR